MKKIINTLYNQILDKREHTAPILWDSFEGENKERIENFFTLYEKGRKEENAPSGYIDYFTARTFIYSILISKQGLKLLLTNTE